MKKLILTSLIVLFLVSCTKEIDVNAPEIASQIVMDAKVYAEDSVLLFLNTSEYYLIDSNSSFGLDTNYEAYLYRDNVLLEKLRPVRNSRYRNYFTGDHAPEIGGRYTIKASRSGWETVMGSCTVPNKIPIHEVKWDTTELGMVIMKVTFKDPPSEADKYLITTSVSRDISYYETIIFRKLSPLLRTFRYSGWLQVENEEQYSDRFFISDDTFNGETKAFELELVRSLSDNWSNNIEEIEVRLYHISNDWYMHEESKFNHYKTFLGIFTEPARIHSNINNGLGLVAGATDSSVKLNF